MRPIISRIAALTFGVLLLLSPLLRSQTHLMEARNASAVEPQESPRDRAPVASDLTAYGLFSYGNYRIFASGRDCALYTGGVEYDRHSWGYLLKARMDYVAEFLPFVMLHEGVVTAPWGQPLTPARRNVPGIGFSPIGFRLLWRSNARIKPYMSAKGGMIFFTKKVPASQAAYENFSLQSAMGVQTRLNDHWDLRLGLFSDFHFSNAFIVPVNPGLDVMSSSLGLTYHLARDRH